MNYSSKKESNGSIVFTPKKSVKRTPIDEVEQEEEDLPSEAESAPKPAVRNYFYPTDRDNAALKKVFTQAEINAVAQGIDDEGVSLMSVLEKYDRPRRATQAGIVKIKDTIGKKENAYDASLKELSPALKESKDIITGEKYGLKDT